MKKKLLPVGPKDLDYPALRLAAEEGRLFIQPRELTPEQMREEGVLAILRYVSRINDCASSAYQNRMAECWERVLRHPRLTDLFFYTHKMRQRNTPNFARVNAVVFLLREKDIYRKDDFTNSALHCLLEGTVKRTNVYMSANSYYPEKAESLMILECFGKPETEGRPL